MIIVVLSIVIWSSDWFQKEFYPKEYWSEQEILYESLVSMDQVMLRDARIDLKKLHITAELVVAQEINMAKFVGLPIGEARESAKEMIKMKIQYCLDEVTMWNNMTKEDQDKLGNIRRKLSRYK